MDAQQTALQAETTAAGALPALPNPELEVRREEARGPADAEVVPDGVRRQKRARLRRAQGTRLGVNERWIPWLSMLSHVFGHDERCPACGAKRWVYDVVLGPWPVRRELLELGIDRSP